MIEIVSVPEENGQGQGIRITVRCDEPGCVRWGVEDWPMGEFTIPELRLTQRQAVFFTAINSGMEVTDDLRTVRCKWDEHDMCGPQPVDIMPFLVPGEPITYTVQGRTFTTLF